MRTAFSSFILLCCVCLSGCRQKSDTIEPVEPAFRLHFAGLDALAADTNLSTIGRIRALPASERLAEQTLGKIAAALPHLLRPDLGTNAAAAEALRALIQRAARTETVFECHHPSGQPASWSLAARVDPASAMFWEERLCTVAKELKLASAKAKVSGRKLDLTGWRAQAGGGGRGGVLEFFRGGDWIVVALAARAPSNRSLAGRLAAEGRPGPAFEGAWLAAEADLARLSPRHGTASSPDRPAVKMTVSSRGDDLRTHLRLVWPEPLALELEPWRIPTNTVRDPLVSFTAVRGFSNWIATNAVFRQFGLEPPPNQLFVWAHAQVPFQTCAAAPLPDATAALRKFAGTLPALLTNLDVRAAGEIRWTEDRRELVWRGLPIVVPAVRPRKDGDLEVLVGEIFPAAPGTNPPPAELLAQFQKRPELVYYDWEITQERMIQWRQLLQLAQIVFWRTVPGADNAADRWLEAVAPNLGNTVTEVTRVGPTQLELVRKSHIGLTGLELAWLARQLDDPNFPFFGPRKPAAAAPAVVPVPSQP